MRKVLIIMHDMASGGAQRSLLTFLSEMEQFKDQYDISLQVMKEEGLFYQLIPSYVKHVDIPNEIACMQSPFISKAFWQKCNTRTVAAKLRWQFSQSRLPISEYGGKHQIWWNAWRKVIPELSTHYDTAVSYMHGYTNYYLIDKIKADKKVMWIHTQYSEPDVNLDFDKRYYAQADQIITVSETCAESFKKQLPDLSDKVKIIRNLSSRQLIRQMAEKTGKPKEYESVDGRILISIGRLSVEKGFDLALAAAKTLKDSGCRFKWFIIGKGPLFSQLQKQSTMLDLNDCIVFLGEQSNPYPYLQYADIFVQTSRIEGKSIVLDEAKILCKPIIATAYDTVTDNIADRKQGLIVKIESSAIAVGIQTLIEDKKLCAELETNLAGMEDDTSAELSKYLQMLDE
jgi:glycosyltransferase involved in cell wall biosynthesis